MDLPKLAIAALGGTVSMQASHGGEGVIPTVSGETLSASVPELTILARVTVETLGLLPSASLNFEFLLSVLSWARYQVEQGAIGVVIIQGTGWAAVIENTAKKIPVIIATRTGSGATAQSSYGFVGGEMDLIRKGASMAGFLCPRKARILLWLLIGCQRQDDLASYL